MAALMSRTRYGAVFMTAAVADYAPACAFEIGRRSPGAEEGEETCPAGDVSASKVKSTYREIAFVGHQTEKLIDLFRTQWLHHGLLVKFKLEVDVSPERR